MITPTHEDPEMDLQNEIIDQFILKSNFTDRELMNLLVSFSTNIVIFLNENELNKIVTKFIESDSDHFISFKILQELSAMKQIKSTQQI